jgi:transposase
LHEVARKVNFVWNYCGELSLKVWHREGRLLSGYDFLSFTIGAGKAGLRLDSQTVQAIGEEYARRRKQAGKAKLRWRVSGGARRFIGWIPYKASAIRQCNGQVFFSGVRLSLWDRHGLASELGAGNISEDARGRWYLNVSIKVEEALKHATGQVEKSVGIDLGVKDFAATSDGQIISLGRHYRKLKADLATAERANRKVRERAIHARIRNCRKDHLHKL